MMLPALGRAEAQPVQVGDEYLCIRAEAGDPLYTTYAAAMERSRLYGDKAYKMDYDSPSQPLHYSGDQAGRFYTVWMVNRVVVDRVGKYHRPPVVTASFPDMAVMEYELYPGVEVQEVFLVYSSSLALVQQHVVNRSGRPVTVDWYPVLELGNALLIPPIHATCLPRTYPCIPSGGTGAEWTTCTGRLKPTGMRRTGPIR